MVRFTRERPNPTDDGMASGEQAGEGAAEERPVVTLPRGVAPATKVSQLTVAQLVTILGDLVQLGQGPVLQQLAELKAAVAGLSATCTAVQTSLKAAKEAIDAHTNAPKEDFSCTPPDKIMLEWPTPVAPRQAAGGGSRQRIAKITFEPGSLETFTAKVCAIIGSRITYGELPNAESDETQTYRQHGVKFIAFQMVANLAEAVEDLPRSLPKLEFEFKQEQIMGFIFSWLKEIGKVSDLPPNMAELAVALLATKFESHPFSSRISKLHSAANAMVTDLVMYPLYMSTDQLYQNVVPGVSEQNGRHDQLVKEQEPFLATLQASVYPRRPAAAAATPAAGEVDEGGSVADTEVETVTMNANKIVCSSVLVFGQPDWFEQSLPICASYTNLAKLAGYKAEENNGAACTSLLALAGITAQSKLRIATVGKNDKKRKRNTSSMAGLMVDAEEDEDQRPEFKKIFGKMPLEAPLQLMLKKATAFLLDPSECFTTNPELKKAQEAYVSAMGTPL